MLTRFLVDESGSAAIEYAAIGSFLSILVMAGATSVGRILGDKHFEALLQAWAKASP